MSRSSKASARELYGIAEQQQGFFSAQQARQAGYADSLHAYHARIGNWERVGRGVYRLALFPASDRPELVTWWLWSRGRDGRPLGTYSHETALEIHGVLEVHSGPLHMIVPRTFRRGVALPEGIRFYKQTLSESDVEQKHGCRVTSLDRTLKDLRKRGIDEDALDRVTDSRAAARLSAGSATRLEGPAGIPVTDWAVWDD